jgi:thiol-disulfide isomerase/thioredoxin
MKLWKIHGLALALGLAAASAAHAGSDIGKPARGYKVTTLDGQSVDADQLKGKVVVLNYWATWCTPCKAELIAFDNYLKAHPNSDLKVFAIETERSLPGYFVAKMQGVSHFTLATSLEGRGYHVLDGVPTSYVIDRNGVIRHAKAGAFNEQSFAQLIEPLLAEPAPAQSVAAK